jgi:hypothetical protein
MFDLPICREDQALATKAGPSERKVTVDGGYYGSSSVLICVFKSIILGSRLELFECHFVNEIP